MAIRITFNSVNIDLNVAPESIQIRREQNRHQQRAKSGKYEQINLYGIEHITFNAHFSDSVYYSLVAWWSWARQGKTFSFAFNSSQAGDTTLDDAAASGQKVIPLTATAAFSVGDKSLVAASGDSDFEVVTIASISAGVSVTAESNLIYTYASGDIFRHFEYWPSLVLADNEDSFEPTRMNDTWSFTFNFKESKA